MQFQQDWPGLFIRGDDAISIAASIRELESHLAGSGDVRVAMAINRLKKIADIIEYDVNLGPGEAK